MALSLCWNEAPRSSLLRRSSRFGCEGWKLRGILRNSPTRRPEPLGGVPKPLPSFAKATEGSPRLHPRSKLRGIRRRRINHTLEEGLHVVLRHRGSAESRRRGLKFGIRDAGYEFRDSRSGIRDPGFKARISYRVSRIQFYDKYSNKNSSHGTQRMPFIFRRSLPR